MGLFDKIFGNKKAKEVEPGWDKFPAFRVLNKEPFVFVSNHFKVWTKGKIISEGFTESSIKASVYNDGSKTKQYRVTVNENNISDEILSEIYFDEFVTSNDRLQLITIPETSRTTNTAVSLFKMTIGSTREQKEFTSNDPFCCNLFLVNGVIKKITFSFSNPDKLIEFENVKSESDKLYEELLSNSKELLETVNENIACKIEERFKTVVNDFGCIHCSDPRFIEFTMPKDIGKFIWCNYFIVPVDYEYELVLPKTYYSDTRTSYSDMVSASHQYKMQEYFSKLGSYEELEKFTEKYTSGASAVIIKILRHPLKEVEDRMIDNARDVEDLRYVVLCYYIDGL